MTDISRCPIDLLMFVDVPFNIHSIISAPRGRQWGLHQTLTVTRARNVVMHAQERRGQTVNEKYGKLGQFKILKQNATANNQNKINKFQEKKTMCNSSQVKFI